MSAPTSVLLGMLSVPAATAGGAGWLVYVNSAVAERRRQARLLIRLSLAAQRRAKARARANPGPVENRWHGPEHMESVLARETRPELGCTSGLSCTAHTAVRTAPAPDAVRAIQAALDPEPGTLPVLVAQQKRRVQDPSRAEQQPAALSHGRDL